MSPSFNQLAYQVSKVILEYQELVEGKDLNAKIAKAFGPGGLGICGVRQVPGLQEVRRKLLPLAHRLATLHLGEMTGGNFMTGEDPKT